MTMDMEFKLATENTTHLSYRKYNSSFLDQFGSPDLYITVQDLGPQMNGYYDGGSTVYINRSEVSSNTVVHEFGHFLGLDHNVSTTSIMFQVSVSIRADTFTHDDLVELVTRKDVVRAAAQ